MKPAKGNLIAFVAHQARDLAEEFAVEHREQGHSARIYTRTVSAEGISESIFVVVVRHRRLICPTEDCGGEVWVTDEIDAQCQNCDWSGLL